MNTDDEVRDLCEALAGALTSVLRDGDAARRIANRLGIVFWVDWDRPAQMSARHPDETHQDRRRRLSTERHRIWRAFLKFHETLTECDPEFQASIYADVLQLQQRLITALTIPSGRPVDENRRAIVYEVVCALDAERLGTGITRGGKVEQVARKVLEFVGDTQLPADMQDLISWAVNRYRSTGGAIGADLETT